MMKTGDICPKCKIGILDLIRSNDPDDIYPNSGIYTDYLYCETCDSLFELTEENN